jgi:hypothetical protein
MPNIEGREFAQLLLRLQANPNCPDLFELEGCLLAEQLACSKPRVAFSAADISSEMGNEFSRGLDPFAVLQLLFSQRR